MEKVTINKDLCIGCGACCVIADENFQIADDGLAEVINDSVNDEVLTAAEGCPTDAITVEKE